eukprot:s2770_g1.t1
MSVHVVVKNIAGEDVVGQLQFADPPSVDELRKRAAARVPRSRFQLLRGSSVLKEDETVSGGTVEHPVLLTLVILPAAGADGGAEVRPLVLEEAIDEQMDILVHDIRTGENSFLPVRYFLAADGKAHLGVLASEAAQMVGADPLAFASLATVSAVFPGEEQTQAALHDSVELWEVTGGAAGDGILVRTGWSLSSPELSQRLATGAIIQQKDIRGERLLYAKASCVKHPVVELIQEAVKAGSHDDPRQLPGLAHFCEHMLFLGTEKYPENSGFDQFLLKYGGSSNAFTASEVTVYFAAASSDAASEGLDRFADFFRAPLFKQDGQLPIHLGEGFSARSLAVKKCLSDIEVADFVALDLEFSGLFVDHQRGPHVLEEYFARCVERSSTESVPKFLALQLGLCCVQFQKEKQVWELRTHEFDLWPQDRRLFMVDLQSLQFLRTHGFDFNSFLERAHPYSRLPPPGHKLAGNAHVKATPVLQALRDAKVPVVLHNGLLDMLHLYDKFLGDLPGDPESFGKAWVEHFPLLFDTRVLAQDGRLDVLQHAGGLSLETLQKHLQSELHGLNIERCTTIAKAAHSAGYDATVTAEVFLMEMDRWIRHANQKAMPEEDAKDQHPNGRKRKRSSDGVEGLSCPSLLESHEVCRRFHNRVALVGTSPGSMELEFVKKEVQAINSEHEKNVQSSGRRIFQLLESQADPSSSVGRFATGNMETLYDLPMGNGTSPVDALKIYFKERYCPEQMKLVTFGPQPLSEQMAMLTQAGFDTLPKGVEKCASSDRSFASPVPFPPSRMGKSLLVQGTEATGSIWAHFQLPSLVREHRAQPLTYLHYLINYGGERSLSRVLSDDLGLVASVGVEEQTDSTGTMCLVVFYTTPLGFNKSEAILDVFFAYLGALRAQGVDMDLYKSLQDMVKLQWNWKQEADPYGTLSDLAEVMTRLPRDKLLSGDSLIEQPDRATKDPDASLLLGLIEDLTPSNMNLARVSPSGLGEAPLKEANGRRGVSYRSGFHSPTSASAGDDPSDAECRIGPILRRTLQYYDAKYVEQTLDEAMPGAAERWNSWLSAGRHVEKLEHKLQNRLAVATSTSRKVFLISAQSTAKELWSQIFRIPLAAVSSRFPPPRRMASKRCGAAVGTAVGLAGVAAGSAFLAGTGGQVKTPALRATATAQQASSSPSSATHFAAASIVASAGAFYASSGRKVAKGNFSVTALKAFESELGVQAPVGFWDPLGLSSDGDAEVFARRREVELKHGRISMFATIGYIVPEYFRWPGELSPKLACYPRKLSLKFTDIPKLGLQFTDIPNGLAALTKVPGQGWGQIVAFLGTYELFINKPVGGEPGNYGKGNLGLGFLGAVADPEARIS